MFYFSIELEHLNILYEYPKHKLLLIYSNLAWLSKDIYL